MPDQPKEDELNSGWNEINGCSLSHKRANIHEPLWGEISVNTTEEVTISSSLLHEIPRGDDINDAIVEEWDNEDTIHCRRGYLGILRLSCIANQCNESFSQDETEEDDQVCSTPNDYTYITK